MFYVYELREEDGTVFYVGKGCKRRMYEHKYKAKSGQKSARSERIRAILAGGGSIIPKVVFETSDETEAFAYEVSLIAYYGRANLTNETDGGGGIRNLSPKARAAIAAGRRGRKADAITRERQRQAKLGTHRTEETKAKIAAYQLGRAKPWARLPKSEAYKQKMSAIKKGVPLSPEQCAAISAAKMGHPVSLETRAKISTTKRAKAKQREVDTHDNLNLHL